MSRINFTPHITWTQDGETRAANHVAVFPQEDGIKVSVLHINPFCHSNTQEGVAVESLRLKYKQVKIVDASLLPDRLNRDSWVWAKDSATGIRVEEENV